MDFDFFGKKTLKKASMAGAMQDNTPSADGTSDAPPSMNMQKLAEDNANRKLNPMNQITGAPADIAIPKPSIPSLGIVPKKKPFMGPVQSK